MKVSYKNRASEKTKKLIKTVFAEMSTEKKDITQITVTELVQRAQINRGTFYSHYDDIYAVAKEYQDDVLDQFMIGKDLSHISMEEYINLVFNCIEENSFSYECLFSMQSPLPCLIKLENLLVDKILSSYPHPDENPMERKLEVNMLVSGAISLIGLYFRHQLDCTLSDIKDVLLKHIQSIA